MRLFGKNARDLAGADIQRLVDEQIQESRQLDYKAALPWAKLPKPEPDKDPTMPKREFLADASALANTAGGLIVCGLKERKDTNGDNMGIPESIEDLGDFNADKLQLWVDSVLADGLRPRLPTGAYVRRVEVGGKRVAVIGIARSFASPHMIWFEKAGRVYRRTDSGKQQADVEELRRMFLEGAEWSDAAERFRAERLELWRHGTHPLGSSSAGSVWVHLLPLGRIHTHSVNLGSKREQLRELTFQNPLSRVEGVWESAFNFEGLLVHNGRADTRPVWHQWLRSGGVEVYSTRFHVPAGRDYKAPTFYATALGDALSDFVPMASRFMVEELDVDAPFGLLVSVLGVGAHFLVTRKREEGLMLDPHQFTSVDLLLPVEVIEDPLSDIRDQLVGLLDRVWQSAGYEKALDVSGA